MKDNNKNIDKDMENLISHFYSQSEDDILKEKWKKKLSEEYNIERPDAKTKRLSWLPIGISIAASLAFFIFIFNAFFNNNNQSIDSNLLIANVQVITNPEFDHRGIDNNPLSSSAKAYNLLLEKNYNDAIDFYENQFTKNTNYDIYHLGLAYLKIHDYKKSIHTLEKLRNADKTFEQEINWLLALNYIKIGDIEKRNNIIEHIINNNHYKAQQAKELKNELKF